MASTYHRSISRQIKFLFFFIYLFFFMATDSIKNTWYRHVRLWLYRRILIEPRLNVPVTNISICCQQKCCHFTRWPRRPQAVHIFRGSRWAGRYVQDIRQRFVSWLLLFCLSILPEQKQKKKKNMEVQHGLILLNVSVNCQKYEKVLKINRNTWSMVQHFLR